MFQPRYVKQAKELAHGARKLLRYRRDLMSAETLEQISGRIEALRQAVAARDKQLALDSMQRLEQACAGVAPRYKHPGWRENIEVLLVAIVVAAGIKAYFLQPFKIPTGSMQPTLNGVIGYPRDEPAPNPLLQVWQFIWNGRNYIDLVSEVDGNRVLELRKQQRLHFFTFTQLVCKDGVHTLMAPPATLMRDFGVGPDKVYNKGDVIARGYIDTGDQVFVDKMSYHFRKPRRGEVFVFKTTGIRKIQQGRDPAMGSQFYIKRLCGMPGDTLRIDPPKLLVDGEVPGAMGIARVIDAENGYRGYSNRSATGGRFEFLGTPSATFTVPSHSYFALGDNSYNSSDSRHWGVVPERNLVGRGFVVYWPFGQNFGLID